MRSTFLLASLLALACGSAFASVTAAPHIGPTHAVDTTVAINPQPLPPHNPPPGEEAAPRVAVNPQPLPPIHGDDAPMIAINPQPLPPHNPPPDEVMLAGGDPPTVIDILVGRRG